MWAWAQVVVVEWDAQHSLERQQLLECTASAAQGTILSQSRAPGAPFWPDLLPGSLVPHPPGKAKEELTGMVLNTTATTLQKVQDDQSGHHKRHSLLRVGVEEDLTITGTDHTVIAGSASQYSGAGVAMSMAHMPDTITAGNSTGVSTPDAGENATQAGPLYIVVTGAPLAGKTTQALLLAARYGLPVVTGQTLWETGASAKQTFAQTPAMEEQSGPGTPIPVMSPASSSIASAPILSKTFLATV